MMKIESWEALIDSCNFDEKVGIKIAKLNGDDQFSTFISVIEPKKAVSPHYHKYGDEYYHIISGSGEIKLKDMSTNEEKSYEVKQYESFTVKENTMHQLINTGSEPLILMFSCPKSHLNDDRYFT